jgi:hypothetical protein
MTAGAVLVNYFSKQIIIIGGGYFAFYNTADWGFGFFDISYAIYFRRLSAASSHIGIVAAGA